MPSHKHYSDQELLQMLLVDDERAVELIFERYYTYLCQSVYRIIPDNTLVEDLTQDVFFELWKKRQQIDIKTSLKAYLSRAGRNKALNYLRDNPMQLEEHEKHFYLEDKKESVVEVIEAQELQVIINQTIDSLPDRCRAIFVLSRFEELSYQEIASQLGISVKTVENQISKALKILRTAIYPHLSRNANYLLPFILHFLI